MFLFAALTSLARPAAGQVSGHAAPPEDFQYRGDADLAALVAKPGALTLSVLSDHENYYVQVAGRTGPGEVEVHRHWIDYMAIQHGEAIFTYGGTVSGARDTGNGEQRGGTITGGNTIALHPGDFVMVPAGQPHLTVLQPGTLFRALVFKVRN